MHTVLGWLQRWAGSHRNMWSFSYPDHLPSRVIKVKTHTDLLPKTDEKSVLLFQYWHDVSFPPPTPASSLGAPFCNN